jgi:hypothetical protein
MVVKEIAKYNPIAKKISNNIKKVEKMKLELVLIDDEFKNNKQI